MARGENATRVTATASMASRHLRVRRAETVWVPLGFVGLAGLMLALVRGTPPSSEVYKVLMALLPLLVGVSAPWTFLGDPARELVMVSPYPTWRLVAHRMGVLMAVWALASALVWAWALLLGVGLAAAAPATRFWLPSLALACLALAAALLARDAVAGGAVAGGLWFAQILFRPYMRALPVGRAMDLFLGLHRPPWPELAYNQVVMGLAALGLALVSARLLAQEERYLG